MFDPYDEADEPVRLRRREIAKNKFRKEREEIRNAQKARKSLKEASRFKTSFGKTS